MTDTDLQPAFPLPQRPPPPPPAPLLPLAVGMIFGIVGDERLTLPTGVAVLLSATGIALWIARHRIAPPKRVRFAAFAALALAGGGVGALRHAVADRWVAGDHIVRFTRDEPTLVRVRGVIANEPSITEPSPDIPSAYARGPKTRFVLEARRIAGRNGPIHASGRVAVTVKGVLLSLGAGDRVEMTGWLYRPRAPQNPGAYDWALRQRRSGLLAGFSCSHAESVVILDRDETGDFAALLALARARLRGYLLDDAFDDDDPGAGVIAAMVLGERSAVSRAMNEAFVKTGNAHFLAASGMHVGWLALMGWGLMRLIGAYYRTTAVVVGLLILSYVLLAEPRPSIMRAGIIGMLGCASVFFRGRTNTVNWLACSAVVILMIDPTDLFRPAFQYSFLAVLALLHFCPHVARAIASWCLKVNLPRVARSFDSALYAATIIQLDSVPDSHAAGLRRWIGFLLAQLFALAVSAWFITTPLSCYHFNNFTPWGWLGTFLLWFIALPVTCVGFSTLFLGTILPSSTVFLGPVLGWATRRMVDWVETLAAIPGTMIDGRSPSLPWVLAVYGALWLWVYRRQWVQERVKQPHAFKIMAVVLLVWWLAPPRWFRADSEALKVWVLAVGDGTGMVIELPNGQVWVYDFGTRSPFDAGRVGVEFLKHRGIRRLDTVLVSHANFDHFSGIETLAREFKFRIGRVVLNDQFQRFAPEKTSGWYFLKSMADAGVTVEMTHGPHTFDQTGDVTLSTVWPPAAADRAAPDANDASTVLHIAFQGRSILLPGDVGDGPMASLLAAGVLHADALALPHHGSVIHNTPAFIAAVDPRVAIRSSGQRRRLTTSGIEALVGDRTYFNTADDGCILLTIRGGRITAEPAMLRRE